MSFDCNNLESFPFNYLVLAKSASYNIYDHDKSARDETSYSLSLQCVTGLFLEARNSLGGEEVIGSLRIALDNSGRVFGKRFSTENLLFLLLKLFID